MQKDSPAGRVLGSAVETRGAGGGAAPGPGQLQRGDPGRGGGGPEAGGAVVRQEHRGWMEGGSWSVVVFFAQAQRLRMLASLVGELVGVVC